MKLKRHNLIGYIDKYCLDRDVEKLEMENHALRCCGNCKHLEREKIEHSYTIGWEYDCKETYIDEIDYYDPTSFKCGNWEMKL
jgi:hypothetical protein